MKIIFLTALSLTLSSCFSTTPNKGVIKQINNNVYKTTYEHYWAAPWSDEDITVTASNISRKHCEEKGMEFTMKSHYFDAPNINIIYTCIDYSDTSSNAEVLRAGSKNAVNKLKTEKEQERKKRKVERADNPSLLQDVNSGLLGGLNSFTETMKRNHELERQRKSPELNCRFTDSRRDRFVCEE